MIRDNKTYSVERPSRYWRRPGGAAILIGLMTVFMADLAPGEEAPREALELTVLDLRQEVATLSEQLRMMQSAPSAETDQALARLIERVEIIEQSGLSEAEEYIKALDFGGYGELHFNFGGDDAADQFDIHRFVLYLGYDFSDWIKFHSETELEHAFTAATSGGEVSIEQAFVDFLFSKYFNVRVGRVLTPMGIINQKHEPTTFNGVERPSFAKYIIPSTWSSDGLGIFGNITSSLKYQLYVVAGLDGAKFNAKDGIRKGRIKERSSFHDPAVTGRLDYYPFATRAVSHGQTLRVGVSGYAGGFNNANKGQKNGINGNVQMYSGDFEYTISKFDFRGAVAHGRIQGAHMIGNGTAEEIFGWYLEGARHVLPKGWKTGKLKEADAVAFVRYDDYNTQYRMPKGVAANPAGDRTDLTMGMNLHLTPAFVVKADYQIRNDASSEDVPNLFNFGLGWQFP